MTSEPRPGRARLEGLTDALFAITATVLVLEIEAPSELARAWDPAALAELGAGLGVYALSFLVIAELWVSHHYLPPTLAYADRTTVWLNLYLLFGVTLIPLAARFFGAFPASPQAAAIYGLALAQCLLAFLLLRAHASRLDGDPTRRRLHRRAMAKVTGALALCLASAPLAFVSVWLSALCFVIIPVMFFVPLVGGGRRVRRASIVVASRTEVFVPAPQAVNDAWPA